jgi:GNAT superfamily N-acetyltransferase
MIIAEASGEMVGIVLSSIQGNHILVGEVAIAAAYQRRGIGSRMLALVEQHASRLGYQRLLLGPETAVEPIWSMRSATDPRALRNGCASWANRSGQVTS